MIRFENVGLRYGMGPEILRDISFNLLPGSFHFLTGPSGAGKTSLLRLLFMSLRPTRGLIFLFNQNVSALLPSDRSRLRRRIGIVFQDFRLLDHLTTWENVALPLRVLGKKEHDYRDDVTELLRWVGLGDRMHAFPPVLSGGEKQRAAIARAVIGKPEILLADEPTGSVDPQIGNRLLRLFVELNRLGTSVVIATHDFGLMDQLNARGSSFTMAICTCADPVNLLANIKDSPWAALLSVLLPERMAPSGAQIVPSASVSGRALTVVIAIMSFLACLTAGAVYIVNQSAAAWVKDIASEVTVELDPVDTPDIEKKITLVSLFLAKQKGITRVKPLSVEESARLLEPWLGKSPALSALPVPRLIAVEIDRSNPPDIALIREALSKSFEGVTLDDHRRWQAEIRTVTRLAALVGVGVLGLVAAATIAIIVSATRSAMASNREIIEVLHFVGASERFISREFERHFLGLGIRAGLIGAVAAAFLFLLLPFAVRYLATGIVTGAEVRRLIGAGDLDWQGYLLFLLVVVVVAGLCMVTSRLGVVRVLKAYE